MFVRFGGENPVISLSSLYLSIYICFVCEIIFSTRFDASILEKGIRGQHGCGLFHEWEDDLSFELLFSHPLIHQGYNHSTIP